jgi:hypothetical protein
VKNKVIVGAAVLVVVFLLSFVPQYLRANRLESELQLSRQDAAGAELRDLIGLAYLQANQKNFGLAGETSSRFFQRIQQTAGEAADATRRKALEELLGARDKVTASLAKGDPGVIAELQDLFLRTRTATRAGQ